MSDRPARRTGADSRLVTTDVTMVPDYYARLGVDPGADRSEIEAALKRLQPAWSMGTRNPKTRHSNQLFLDEIPALRKALLGDPASRAAYDAELAVVQIAERDAKLDELQKRARLRAAKGGLSPSDRTLLVEEAARLGLTEDDLSRHQEHPHARRGRRRQWRRRARPGSRRPTCSTRRLAGRFGWCSSIWAAVISTTLSAYRAMLPKTTSRPPTKSAALDEKSPGHRREDSLARDHHHGQSHLSSPKARAVRSHAGAGGRGVVRRAWRSSRSRGSAGSTRVRSMR